MHIVIFTLGSRGDVQPFIALGLGLQEVGYSVTIATHGHHKPLVEKYGLRFALLPGNSHDYMREVADVVTGSSIVRFNLLLVQWVNAFLADLLEAIERIGQDADVIMATSLVFQALYMAEKLNKPAYVLSLFPVANPTREFSSLLMPSWFGFGGFSNLLTHHLERLMFTIGYRRMCNRWCTQKLGLPSLPFFRWPYSELNGRPIPYLFGFSPSVIPRPSDWNEHSYVTGYWFLDMPHNWNPSRDLLDFLEAGSVPVYIGFGSAAEPDPNATFHMIVEALALSKQRGIIARGNSQIEPQNIPDNIYVVDAVPHDWLFPRMAVIVHHGGAGSTAAGLRSGVPSILIPHFGDQPFWGRRIQHLGVGPQPIARKQLTAEKLAAAICEAILDTDMRQRACELGETIQSEDGVGQAVQLVQRYLA